MLVEPGVEVNAVIQYSSADPDGTNTEGSKERLTDAQISAGLFAGEASDRGRREDCIISLEALHHQCGPTETPD